MAKQKRDKKAKQPAGGQAAQGAAEINRQSAAELIINMHRVLKQRLIPLRFTGVTSRVFNLWKAEGIIEYPEPPGDKDRERVILTIPEYLWIRIVYCLRLFNVRNNIVLRLREDFFRALSKDEYIQANAKDANSAEDIPLENYLPAVQAGGTMGHLFLISIQFKSQIDILVYPTGEGISVVNRERNTISPHLKDAPVVMQIDFSTLAFEVVQRMYELNKPRGFLTENEQEILDYMDDEKADSLEIVLQNGESVTYSWKEKGADPAEDIPDVIKIFKGNNYISATLRAGSKEVRYGGVRSI
ncbi:MAG: hypothetical protein V4543_17915 [Bacteroidota bacterium]